MNNILTIIKKELTRVFTDKGMILSLFILPPLTIFIIYGLMGVSAEKENEKITEYVPTVYVVNKPDEITFDGSREVDEFGTFISTFYENINLNYVNGNNQVDSLIEDLNNEKFDLLIVFPDTFEDNIINKTNPNVDLYYNVNSSFSQNTNLKFQTILNSYSKTLLNTRIEDQNLLKVFDFTPIKKGNIEQEQSQILSMILPMLIVIYLMAGAMGVGMESISGEKERGTIATLLVTPIKRSELAIGKIISIAIIGLMSSIASFLGLVGVLPIFSKISGGTEGPKDMDIVYGFMDFFKLLTIMLVAVLLFVTLIVIISAYAKSVKQAGTLIMPVYLIVIGAAMFNMFSQTVDQTVTPYLIPVFNIVLALKAVFAFKLGVIPWLATIGTTVIYTAILIFIIQKMFRSEKIMFNK